MQCDEFDRRFNELLDLRQDPADDSQLAAHAGHCPQCEIALEDWLRIGRAFAPSGQAPSGQAPSGPLARSPAGASERLHWSGAALAATLAASLLGGVWFAGRNVESKPPIVAESAAPVAALDFQQIGSQVAQPAWWGSVVRAAWEPVDPLAEGFRPLTNSLQTAFELLTPRAGASTTVPSALPEDANVGIAAAPPRLV